MESSFTYVSVPRRYYDPNQPPEAGSLQEPHPTVEVPEALIQDLWKHQRFSTEDLTTTDGTPVQILDPGRHNSDAGPDFENAHVRIGSVDWRGHVEIHTSSSVWFEHRHNTDARYNSVILHVTLRADVWTGGLPRADESIIPEIVIYPHLNTPLRELLHAYHTREDDDALPCASRWDRVPESTKCEWVAELARTRLLEKRDRLKPECNSSLDQLLHERLYAGLGYSKNDEPMSTLANRLPPETLRSMESARNREALHLGVADLLPSPKDLLEADRETADYAMDLRDRFRRLQVRHDIPVMSSPQWTFFRLRPNNFPPLRIAQAAAWYDDDSLLASNPLPTLRAALSDDDPAKALLEALSASPAPFWRTHYHLEKASSEHDPSLGPTRRKTLIVNAVVPILMLDAERRDDPDQAHAAVDVLRSLSPSRDKVVRRFADLGTEAKSAFECQGLHQLYREYCSKGGCLDCAIGKHLLNP